MVEDKLKKHLGEGQTDFHEVFTPIIGGSTKRTYFDDKTYLYEFIGTIATDGLIDGEPGSVDFSIDMMSLAEMDDKYNCVVGFHHTHPSGMPSPSTTDINTMDAWVRFLGKPLVLTIYCDDKMHCFVFDYNEWEKTTYQVWDGDKLISGCLLPDGSPNKYSFLRKKLTIKGGVLK